MSRSRDRVNLSDGLRLDLTQLRHQGIARPGARVAKGLRWTHSYWGEIANALITCDMRNDVEGYLTVAMGSSSQTIIMVPQRRHFGGRQWYFICPVLNRRCSVLYRPPGATRFCSRQTWGRQVAYASQFETPVDRAWRAKHKIKARLIGNLDPEEWDFPPKPKGMRWRTYNRHMDRFDDLDAALDHGIVSLLARFEGKK